MITNEVLGKSVLWNLTFATIYFCPSQIMEKLMMGEESIVNQYCSPSPPICRVCYSANVPYYSVMQLCKKKQNEHRENASQQQKFKTEKKYAELNSFIYLLSILTLIIDYLFWLYLTGIKQLPIESIINK